MILPSQVLSTLIIIAWDPALVLTSVHLRDRADLPQVGRAFERVGLRPRRTEGGEQDGDQQRDNADDHQQFDQGKTFAWPAVG